MEVTRTCIGCRRRAPTADLLRLLLVDGRLVVGARTSHPGRGASIHPREVCVATAVRTHAFARAFPGLVARAVGKAEKNANAGAQIEANVDGKLEDSIRALRALMKDIEVAHVLKQPRAGRTP